MVDMITSYLRRKDISMLFWRGIDVIITPWSSSDTGERQWAYQIFNVVS